MVTKYQFPITQNSCQKSGFNWGSSQTFSVVKGLIANHEPFVDNPLSLVKKSLKSLDCLKKVLFLKTIFFRLINLKKISEKYFSADFSTRGKTKLKY